MQKISNLYLLLIGALSLLLFGCGSGGSSGSASGTIVETDAVISAIQLSASQTTIGTGETTLITARLFSENGQLISGSKTITFTFDNPILASISSPVLVSSGVTTQTLTAADIEGSVILTVDADEVSEQITLQISDASPPGSMVVTANPDHITMNGTSVVSARILDTNGVPMLDGTAVSFNLANVTFGSIVPNANVSGGNGVALATFSAASDAVGVATISASTGNISESITIPIAGASAGSIEFVSAVPQIIVIKGSGGQETSLITFLVKDSNGDPISVSQTVRLTLSGPEGGEYLGATYDPLIDYVDIGTVNGVVSTVLHSGSIPGTATVVAEVDGTALSTSSGVIAIGGGVPSEGHFSLSTEKFNLEGLAWDGITTEITVRIADRYGNFNVLQGTAVSFYSECGAIDRAINLSADGEGSVSFRTQRPNPHGVSFIADNTGLDEVYSTELDVTLDDGNNPWNGLCTIVAVVDGEEEFNDSNADGAYNPSEMFSDTYDDIHLDKDDDPNNIATADIVDGYPFDSEFEDLIIDRAIDGVQNGSFDGFNDKWDDNKRISRQIKLLMTGVPNLSVAILSDGSYEAFDESRTISVVNGGQARINFAIHDVNYNPPMPETKITVTSDVGRIAGTTSHTFLDTNSPGAPIFSVIISDDDATVNETKIGTLEFKWDWKGNEYSTSFLLDVH